MDSFDSIREGVLVGTFCKEELRLDIEVVGLLRSTPLNIRVTFFLYASCWFMWWASRLSESWLLRGLSKFLFVRPLIKG